MTKAQHDPHDLAQWLLSRDGDLANLAGRELEKALDRVEKAEAVDDSIMDTAYLVGHKKGWNEAIDAAATLMGEDAEQMKLEGDSDAWMAREDAKRIRALKKGADQ